jgi:predicted dehydrogenase
MINVGLLGYGLAERVFHAPFLNATPELRLTAIATRNSAARGAQDYPAVRIGSARDVITASDTDLIVIASPNQSHAELALQALDAGKSVVVDRPMAVSLAEAQQMVECAEKRSLKLCVFQNRRWDDDFLTLRHLLTAGTVGEWTGFESHFDRFRPVVPERWRERPAPGGGLWWDLGPHLLDQALQLLGPLEAAENSARRRGAVDL